MLEILRNSIHNVLDEILDEAWAFNFSNMPREEFEAEIYEYFKPQVEYGDYTCFGYDGLEIRNKIFDLAIFYHII